MERNSPTSQVCKLESQIRQAYGRVVYTLTCHNKIIQRLLSRNNKIKVWQIILSVLTTGSFLTTILYSKEIASFVGAFISIGLLILNGYTKNFDLVETAQSHQKAADALWKIREEYVSLLTDFDLLELSQIMERRDDLQNRTAEIYAQSPRTDAKSYKEAQKALKTEEEQTFSEKEINVMLPNSLRRETEQKGNTM
ncbi:SLATT domain-containing protein [Paenibacillus larvae]|uniref:SLATT domain-containing protein n=1 Tax=Paenibacillus larvae TaxID=1464 RepID=UPI002282B649|nr:SLATT domain-containing protein [Paenibacillus larvae]MCY9747944.1 SLATT domain-containing protein [Paenibacillus larvae]MCY9750234.1 SLATT domain-containing protein [Paenibacillus larvae]